MSTPSPRRLALSRAEYAGLVRRLGLTMPSGWEPAVDVEYAEAGLSQRGVLNGSGDLVTVHPSVAMNLRVLAGPQVMLDTTVTIGNRGSHSLHAVAGRHGASLFALAEGGIELSLFAAVDLGRELIRAVPPEPTNRIGSLLPTHIDTDPMRGRVRLAALERLHVTAVIGPDPGEPNLPHDEAELARHTARHTDGALRCVMTGRTTSGIRTSQVIWLHTASGWVGLRPDPDGSGESVRLEPAAREELGPWTAPFVAAVLA